MNVHIRPLLVGAQVLALIGVAQAETSEVRQDGADPNEKEYKAEAPERPQDMPLARLPTPPSKRLPPPRPRALEAIDLLLKQVVSENEITRQTASRSLSEAKSDWVSGLARRTDRLAERGDKKGMKALLKKSREATRARLEEDNGAAIETPDYLQVVHRHADPTSQTWRDLTQLLAISRMFSAIGTTEAVREIIRIHVRFGEFMRIDCQRQLEELGDLSIAGLIETRRHQAPKIAQWAEKRLKLRNKLIAHEAVRTEDPQALADILVALGSLREPESTRLLISFAGTERAQVRAAARQGIALLGDVAAWQLRDAYLNTTGKRPPRDWTWKRTARELFTEFDRLRLEKLYRIFAEAKKAETAGDSKKMLRLFDKILVENPNFDRRKEMAESYVRFAASDRENGSEEKLLALTRAERISADPVQRDKARGLRKLLEAQRLRKRGIVDQTLLDQASQLNPELSQIAREARHIDELSTSWSTRSRYLVAGITSLLALVGASWILVTGFRRRSDVTTGDPPKRTSSDPGDKTPPKDNGAQSAMHQDGKESPRSAALDETFPVSSSALKAEQPEQTEQANQDQTPSNESASPHPKHSENT